MNKEEILSKLKTIIADKLGITETEITEEKTLRDDLGADSLDGAEVILEIEKEFSLEIPDADSEKFTNIKSIVAYISGHTK